jgi:23S rRNA (adenine2503-C2)-methyltransferase
VRAREKEIAPMNEEQDPSERQNLPEESAGGDVGDGTGSSAPPGRADSGPARIPLLGLTAEEMRSADGPLKDLPPFRARQVAHWLYARGETGFEAMTDIALPLRQELARRYTLTTDPVVSLQRAQGDEALKFLFRLHDGRSVEAVLINAPRRRTICISSQAGCAYGCTFCATAAMGPGRNLDSREIVSQVLAVRRQMREDGLGENHNLVFMGMGEPLANLKNLIPALRLLQADAGLAVGHRRITVSTVGLPPQILELADADVKVRLAFSLNATTPETRSALMPVNRKYPFTEVFAALQEYRRRKRMRVTLEYILLQGINDSSEDAVRLAGFARDLSAKVNLIAYNPHPAAPYQPSSPEAMERFVQTMYPIAPTVTLRYSKGRDILAACGQLSTAWKEGGA